MLNVPLNHDLNHRLFEVMAAGVPQILVIAAFWDTTAHWPAAPICCGPTHRGARSTKQKLLADPTRLEQSPDKLLLGPQSTPERALA